MTKNPEEPAPPKFLVEAAKSHQNLFILKIAGLSNRDEALKFKGFLVGLSKSEARRLPANHYYIFDLIGLNVFSEEEKFLGKITDVWQQKAGNDILVLKTEQGEKLIPAIKDVVKAVDLAQKKMVVKIIPGMLD